MPQIADILLVIATIAATIAALPAIAQIREWLRSALEVFYLDPSEPETAEHMSQYTAARTATGLFLAHFSVRPRKGLILTGVSFRFFDKRILPWPWGHGRPQSTKIIRVSRMRHVTLASKVGTIDCNLDITDERTYADSSVAIALANGDRCVFGMELTVSQSMKRWEGILSFDFHYKQDGNPRKTAVRMKFFVRHPDERRPWRAIGHRILKCPPLGLVPDTQGSPTPEVS